MVPGLTPSEPPPSNAALPPGSETLEVGGWQVVVADGHAVLPEGMTHLPDDAFRGRASLVSVAFSSSLVSIGIYAFYRCSSLVSIDLPASLTSIGDGAFRDCSALTSVTFPASLTSIGDEAFANCSSLARVAFPAGLTSIGREAFRDCYSLTRVTVPSAATIGVDAFASYRTTVHRRSPTKMRWYNAVDRTLAYKRFALEHKVGLLGWLERANIRLGSYGPDGVARKRDREEFEGDFGHGAAAGSSGA